jgi:cytochrome c
MRSLTSPVTITLAVAALLLTCAAAASVAAADTGSGVGVGAGSAAFNNNCRTCHSAKEGDNRLGPSLHKIIGAKAGSRPGYPNYSQAMKSSGIAWDEMTLDRFIANPEEVVPNDNMKPFKGIPDPATRKSIIDYLKAESGKG